jgi:hypothetical protein
MLSLQHVYFQGSTLPESSSLDSPTGGHSIKTNKYKADGSVNQELYQKKTGSDEPHCYHNVSIQNHV